MTGSERHTRVQTTYDTDDRRQRIRKLNDGSRRHGEARIICITAGVQALGDAKITSVLAAVQTLDAFTSDNDPYDGHDFGAFTIDSQRMFWKIDYYDVDLRFGSPDPADPIVTSRVLTIMLASEY